MYYDDDYYYGHDESAGAGCFMVLFFFLFLFYVLLAVLVGSLALGVFVGLVLALFNYGKSIKKSLDNQPFYGVFDMNDGIAKKAKDCAWRLRDVFKFAQELNHDKKAEIKSTYSNQGRSVVVRGVKGVFHFGRIFGLIGGGFILNIALTLVAALLSLLVMGTALAGRRIAFAVGYVLEFIRAKKASDADI